MSAILATLYSRLDESELASTLILHLVNFTEPSLQQEQDIQIVINASIIKGRVESAWKWMRRAVDGAPVEEEGDRLKLLSQSIGHILDLCFTGECTAPLFSASRKHAVLRLTHIPKLPSSTSPTSSVQGIGTVAVLAYDTRRRRSRPGLGSRRDDIDQRCT